MSSQRTSLILVRHGQTSANTDGLWHGSTNTPLSEEGRNQATRVARGIQRRFSPDALYSSDLERARHTAEAISTTTGCEVLLEPGLREYDLGEWEGRSYRELYDREELWRRMAQDPHYAPHGGETPLAVATRVTDALKRVADAHPGGRVVCVSHGGAISIALGQLLDKDHSRWDRLLDNCAVAELHMGAIPELIRLNETWD